MTIASGSLALASDMLKHVNANGYLNFAAATTKTIAAGVIAQTQNWHLVDTEAAASTDDLDTISVGGGATDGYVLVIAPANDARTVVIRHNIGNILCAEGFNYTLDNQQDFAILIYKASISKWLCVATHTVDNSTIEVAQGVTQVKALGIGTAQLAADSVDDTKVGNRVPQFYRRQGGSSVNFRTAGITNFTPSGGLRIQWGVITVSVGTGQANPQQTVTFPVAFSDVPNVFLQPLDSNARQYHHAAQGETATDFVISLWENGLSGSFGSTFTATLGWWAIGPE